MARRRSGAATAAIALLVAACTSGADTVAPPESVGDIATSVTEEVASLAAADDTGDTYRATIRRTSFGVPHIEGPDFGSVMFGQGYAFAEDRACTLLDQVVKVRSERSRWFGPGDDDANLATDFAYLHLGLRARAVDYLADEAPPEIVEQLEAYVAGFNLAVAELGNDALPGWCAGEPWADTEVTEVDLLMYFNDLMLLASSAPFLDSIGTVQPPEPGAAPSTVPAPADDTAPATTAAPGSNGWAIGADWSTAGGGLLLANPHFPWEGELRLWESHLTVPGELDLYGATLSGVPGVLIGFTEQFGWTHTVSAGSRFTAYRLPLVEGDPTAYTYDGGTEAMTPTEYSVSVRQDDGSLETVDRTLWTSRYGPIISVGPLGWDSSFAFSLRDANVDNLEALAQFRAMNNADDFDEFRDAHAEHNGIPWVNTIAVSADGRAWYADTAATPRLSDAALAAYEDLVATDPVVATVADNGAFLLDGSDPRFEWTDAPGARDDGLVPFTEQPQLERTDYVYNANNSYWLAHPDEPLTGFSPLHGGEGEAPGGRARINDVLLRESAGADGTYTAAELEAALLSNRSLTGEQWRDAVVARCRASGRIELADACDVLDGWDAAYHTDSVGAVLWSTLLDELFAVVGGGMLGDGTLWAEPWDPDRPTTTPNGLATDEATVTTVLDALSRAVVALDSAGIPLDAPLGEIQRDARPGSDVGLPGTNSGDIANITSCCARGGSLLGPEAELGTFDPIHSFTDRGIIPVTYGASFVMALEFLPDGPSARAVLTYGQPDDPADPDFTSQTELWGAETLRPVLFRAEDIAADPNLTERVVAL